MKTIKVRNTYNIKITGAPSNDLELVPKPQRIAVLPSVISHVKPKALVKVGDEVLIGSPLYFDKSNEKVQFLSPGAGKIVAINLGERRSLQEIVIELAQNETYVELEKFSETELHDAHRGKVIAALINGGLWSLIRELPFKNIVNPDHLPPAIYVSVEYDGPFQPKSEVFLKDKLDQFRFGLKALNRLSDNKVVVAVPAKGAWIKKELHDVANIEMVGDYPAMNPATVLYHNKKDSAENKAWIIKGQDVLLIAELLSTGHFPNERVISVGGSGSTKRQHYQIRMGTPLKDIIGSNTNGDDQRIIAGGILTGRLSSLDAYMGFYETAINIIPEGREQLFMGFIQPGTKANSFGNTFLSATNKTQELSMTTNIHGQERACINCDECPKVCPVDILPQNLMKSVIAGEVDDSLELGLLDCTDCGLCTYVCPSKIEVAETIRQGKESLAKELNAL